MSKRSSYRKFASTAMIVAVATSAVAPIVVSAEQQFTDVSMSNDHYNAINEITKRGIVSGFPDGTFKPESNLYRAQAAVIFTKALNLDIPSNIDEVLSVYTDVDANSEYAEEIAAVTAARIFKGNTEGKFNGWTNINREQVATILVKAYKLNDIETEENVEVNLSNVDPSHRQNVQILANLGITRSLEDFLPANSISRGQFSTFLHRAILNVEEVEEDPTIEEPTEPEEPTPPTPSPGGPSTPPVVDPGGDSPGGDGDGEDPEDPNGEDPEDPNSEEPDTPK